MEGGTWEDGLSIKHGVRPDGAEMGGAVCRHSGMMHMASRPHDVVG